MRSRDLLVIGALLIGCKTRGTIEIGFTLGDDGAEACVAQATHSLLYAEPNVSCPCACGSCFGAKPDGVNGCEDEPDQFCDTSLRDVALDLHPGHWAVVLALLDDSGRQVASGCVEVQVDADGVNSRASTDGKIYCDAACGSAQAITATHNSRALHGP